MFYGEERVQPVPVSDVGHPKPAAYVYPETPVQAHKLTITQHTCAVEESVYRREEQVSRGPPL